jgi:hypothetical protein
VCPSFFTGKQTPEHGMETSGITSEKEIQEATFCGKGDAHNFLGLTRGNTGTLSGKWCKSTVYGIVRC